MALLYQDYPGQFSVSYRHGAHTVANFSAET